MDSESAFSSLLLTHLGNITGITASGSIQIDYVTDTTTHVNDGAGSVLSLVASPTLIVNNVPIADIAALLTSGTDVIPAGIIVSDSTGHIQNDLESGSPVLVTYASAISAIVASPSGTITLDADHALVAGVDDGVGSVFAQMTGATLDVTGALVSQLTALAGLLVPPASITVSDSAAHLEAALHSGSTLVDDVTNNLVTAIASTDVDVSLAYTALNVSVDAALALLPSDSLLVTAVSVAEIATVAGLSALAGMTVSDSAAAIGADLVSMPSELNLHASKIIHVGLTDSGAIGAAAAAGVALLAAKLTGTIAVSDTAADVNTYLTGLETLATASVLTSVTVDDSAADIAPYASTLLAALPTTLAITLTDGPTPTMTAAAAVELGVLSAQLDGVTIDVADTLADIAASAAGLAGLDSLLGTITISSGGNAADYADFIALSQVATNFHAGIVINVTGNATEFLSGYFIGAMAALYTAGHLGTIVAAGDTVTDIVTNTDFLAEIGATATISDLAANVSTNLDALETAATGGVLTAIALTDSGTPDITLSSLAQLTSDATVLALIGTPFDYAITDTSTAIATDLGAAGSSHLLTLNAAGQLGSITVTGGTLSIGAGTLLASGVDDSATAAVTRLVADTVIAATGVSIADFASFATSLHVQPSSFAVSDTGGAIAGDLESGVSSALLAHHMAITGIIASGAIEIDYATDTAAHVNDGAGSVLSLVDTPTLIVDDVAITDIATVLTSVTDVVVPTTVNISDSAGDIQDDLESSRPLLLAYAGVITAIAATGTDTITLDADHALGTGIDDGYNSVFSKLTGASLAVSDATVAQLADLAALPVPAASVAVSDDAGVLEAALVPASALVDDVASGLVTSIASDGGYVSIAYAAPNAQVTAALALLPSSSLIVTGVPITGIASVDGYSALLRMTVLDSAADIATDLNGGSSLLVEYASKIGNISLTDSNPISAAAAAGVSPLAPSLAGLIEVTDTVANVNANLSGLETLANYDLTSLTLHDSAADIAPSAAALFADFGTLLHVTLTDSTPLSLDAATAAELGVLSDQLSGVTINVTDTLDDIVANAVGLAALGSDDILGTIGISSGNSATTTAANAASLAQLAGYFGSGITINVADSAAQIAAHVSGLATLETDMLLGTVTAAGQSAAAIASYAGTLHSLGATATISDTAADVSANLNELETPAANGVLTAITLTDSGTPDITLSLTQFSTDAAVLALMGTSFDYAINDTSADIAADLGAGGDSAILTLNAADPDRLDSITVSDGALSLSATTLLAVRVDDSPTAALTKLVEGTVIAATSVSITDFGLFAAALLLEPTSFAVSDTGSAIANNLALGVGSALLMHRTAITGITASGSITLSYTTDTTAHVNDGTGSVLSLVASPTLIVDAVPVADVAALLTAASGVVVPGSITVSDGASAIQDDLTSGSSVLVEYRADITAIAAPESSTITLDADQALATGVDDGVGSVFYRLSGASLDVTGALVSQLTGLAALGVTPVSVTVSDSAVHIAHDLLDGSNLVTYVGSGLVTAIASDNGDLTLDYSDLTGPVIDALAVLATDTLKITNVPVIDIATVAAMPAFASMTVQDNGADIIAALGAGSALALNAAYITNVDVTDGVMTLTGAAVLAASAAALGTLSAGAIDATGVTAADIAMVAGYAAVGSMTVSDTAADIVTDLTNVTSALEEYASQITAVTVSGGPVALTDAQADAVPLALAILPPTSLTVSAVPLSDLATIAGLSALLSLGVQATAAALDTDLAKIVLSQSSLIQTHLSVISSITPTNGTMSLTDAQADAALTELAKLVPDSLTVTGVPASDAANIASLGSVLVNLAVQDTTADVMSHIGALHTYVVTPGVPMTIDLTDAVTNTIAMTLSASAYQSDAPVLDTVTNATGIIEIADTASAIAAIASTLLADPMVGAVEISDTTADILANLTALETLGSKLTLVSVTDTSLSASEVASLMTIPHLATGSLIITDTGSQIAAAIEANTNAAAFLNMQTVELSGNSVIAASDAAALEQLTNLSLNGHALVVWDTASHLTDTTDGYLAAVQNSIITAVYLKTTGGTATITAATAAALLTIATFSKDNPPIGVGGTGGTNVVTLVDTAAHIDSQYSALHGHTGELSGIDVSASATVSDGTFGDLLALGAVMAASQTLTVRDLPATILAALALGQLNGTPSIVPTVWQLSGSATVTETQAAALGALPGIIPGANTLTLSTANGQLTISYTDANDLANLGSALHLNGNQLIVDDNVTHLLTLSTAAKAMVTVNVTDTFAEIATLVPGDGLLNGTITVSDSNPAATVAEATSFFGLLGVTGGIVAANVSFSSHVETVTDTVADIQTLLSYSGWTANSSLHSDFHLVAADTVLDLVGASAPVLAALYGTTLSGNQTGISAANAETVAEEANFTLGGFSITIQDSAANLLNPVYSDGEALAAVWLLASPDTVSAAGAETLLPDTQFHLNTLLTISDTSDNLLDGVLTGVIDDAAAAINGYGGTIHVTLSDSETLDANTAEALVHLPDFDNTGELSIADGSSYLLNANNLSAENAATYVTLAGDETVSAATAVKLAAVPHFALDGNTLFLASADYASGTALATLADMGSGFQLSGNTLTLTSNASVDGAELAALGDFGSFLVLGSNTITLTSNASVDAAELAGIGTFGANLVTGSNSITLTQDALDLTPAEYNALQSDNVQLNSNLWSAAPSGVMLNENTGTAGFSGTGVNGATVHLYNASGTVLTSTSVASSVFNVSASDSGVNFALTETVGGTESAPLIYLEQTILTGQATTDSATFASSGQIQVAGGEYLDLYTAGSQPGTLVNPVLVYNPGLHTLSYDDSHGAIVLVTLGTSTHPASLDLSEIIVKHA